MSLQRATGESEAERIFHSWLATMAKGQQCHKCHQTGHFKKMCKEGSPGNKNVRSIEENANSDASDDS